MPDFKLGQYAGNYLKWLFIFSIVVNILMLATPMHMLQIYDRVLSSGSLPTLVYLTVIIIFVLCIGGFADYSRRLVAQRLAARYTSETSGALLRALTMDKSEGGTSPRVIRDFALVRNFLSTRTFISLFDLPFTPFFLLVMYLLNVWLGLIVTVGLIIMLALAFLNKKAAAPDQDASRKADSDAVGYASATFGNAEEIRAMGMLPAFQHRWGLKLLESLKSSDRSGWNLSAFASGSKTLRQAIQVIVISSGAFLVLSGKMSGGMIFAASMITNRVLSPIDQIIGGWDSIVRAREAHERVHEVAERLAGANERLRMPDPRGDILIENVVFKPAGSRRPILNDISMHIPPGQFVVLTGATGSGKSSLARILAGAIKPTSGTVRIDGTERDHWQDEQWGEMIGYVAQEFDLLPATIAENIARLSYGLDEGKLMAAAGAAGVHSFVTSMPNGYDTRVGRGSKYRLSGGQKQRIALARAIYGNPRVLILDEPDSDLDQEGRDLLLEMIRRRQAEGVTVFAISHQPPLIEAADRVLVMEKAGVVEQKAANAIARKPARKTAERHVAEHDTSITRNRGTTNEKSVAAAPEAPVRDDTATVTDTPPYPAVNDDPEFDRKFVELRQRIKRIRASSERPEREAV